MSKKESPGSRHEDGGSLLELMTVVLIIAVLATSAMPLLRQQMAIRQIETTARRFIAHAQFARGQALRLGITVRLMPAHDNRWEQGWVVQSPCPDGHSTPTCIERRWIAQGSISPIYFKGGGKQFMDPHSAKRGIAFNAAGAAKSGQGGFVANRLILGHEADFGLERQLILSSGGRWRMCDPQTDRKACR